MQIKTAGVLGGMGPETTVDFMSKVLAQTSATKDQDHLRLIIDHNPKVPNRIAAIDGTGESSGSHLAEMAVGLERSGADFLVMVCNTAHAFQKNIENAVKIPFISIVDEVISELKQNHPKDIKVGIMATSGCIDAQLYQDKLTTHGYQSIVWDPQHQIDFMETVTKIKAGDTGDKLSMAMKSLANNLINNGADVLIAGCTEIPLVLNPEPLSASVIESTSVLVKSVIDYSLGKRDLLEIKHSLQN